MLARLLDVDRQGIHRFSAQDRQRLMREYVDSVKTDGAACTSLDCGSNTLRSHVSEWLRKSGNTADARQLARVYEKTLSPKPQVSSTRVPPERMTPEPRLYGIRQLGQYMITWVDKAKFDRQTVIQIARTVPGWAWSVAGLAYLVMVVVRLRMQSRARVQSLLISS